MHADKITVATTATLVANGGSALVPNSVQVTVPSGGATVYFGGAAVDTTDGYPVAATETLTFELTDDLYAVVAASTQDVSLIARHP